MKRLSESKRLVIKLGTQIVIDETGHFAEARVEHIISQILHLIDLGHEVLLVSSGAVGLGRGELDLWGDLSLEEKQACAAVGQSLLIERYRALFGRHNRRVAQLLLTDLDFSDREHYLNLTRTFEALIEKKVVPIINENDPVSSRELKAQSKAKSFGDNDRLSALVASKLGAQALIILTNVDGVFTSNPADDPNAKLIREIKNIDELASIKTSGGSLHGRGGMQSKLEAARIAAYSGVSTLVVSGLNDSSILNYLNGTSDLGTWIAPISKLSKREAWIGFAAGYEGLITVNEGARRALLNNASLLSVGVTKLDGTFDVGDVVSIRSERGEEIGRGIARCNHLELPTLIGKTSHELAALGRDESQSVIVHRDDLVVLVGTNGD